MTLSDRLQSMASAGIKPGAEMEDGRDYVEEVRGFTGVKYRCNLCHVSLEHTTKEAHIKEIKHKELHKIVKEKATFEEQLVLGKHETMSPTEEEFQAVKDIVLSCEKALKLVSDQLSPQAILEPMSTDGGDSKKSEETKKDDASRAAGDQQQPASESPRTIKGVMRAGLLANGLLVKGEVNVHLVLLSADKPTVSLLSEVADILPKQLATVTEEKYDVTMEPENACLFVTAQKDPKAMCKISLTSHLMRRHPFEYYNTIAPPDAADGLPRKLCEESLRELRRARWFEAKAYSLPFCEIVMRVFRDLCHRVPTWTRLDIWLLELLVQKCLCTLEGNATAATAVQRVFECVAGGILLPDSPGVYDPCEREPTDLCLKMSVQEREDITASAQHALRLIAFQQMHKILDMEDITADSKGGNKRKRSDTDTAEFTTADKKR